MAAHDQEELLNGKLAELLAEQGLDARPERRGSGRCMDTVVFAVCYPGEATMDSLAQARPIWAVRTRAELRSPAHWSEQVD